MYSFTDWYTVQHSIGWFSHNYTHTKLDRKDLCQLEACSMNNMSKTGLEGGLDVISSWFFEVTYPRGQCLKNLWYCRALPFQTHSAPNPDSSRGKCYTSLPRPYYTQARNDCRVSLESWGHTPFQWGSSYLYASPRQLEPTIPVSHRRHSSGTLHISLRLHASRRCRPQTSIVPVLVSLPSSLLWRFSYNSVRRHATNASSSYGFVGKKHRWLVIWSRTWTGSCLHVFIIWSLVKGSLDPPMH